MQHIRVILKYKDEVLYLKCKEYAGTRAKQRHRHRHQPVKMYEHHTQHSTLHTDLLLILATSMGNGRGDAGQL